MSTDYLRRGHTVRQSFVYARREVLRLVDEAIDRGVIGDPVRAYTMTIPVEEPDEDVIPSSQDGVPAEDVSH